MAKSALTDNHDLPFARELFEAAFLNPSERANAHLCAGNAYLALENRARLFYRIELCVPKPENDLLRQLRRLGDDLNELNTTSPQATRIFKRAARNGRVVLRDLTTGERLDPALRTETEALEASPRLHTVGA